ncbi:hypothetical protein EG327_008821 [Venturia inaequalis]|uniref:Phenol 2-monooxygenase n=1 Tax=Venturia inaequalis TaxID=5025 RepID=A0A8H3UT39_VENIN|nr:hypothetical protein EG327_008821 [Venturia inaequalis]
MPPGIVGASCNNKGSQNESVTLSYFNSASIIRGLHRLTDSDHNLRPYKMAAVQSDPAICTTTSLEQDFELFDIVIAGAGPAGLLLSVLLARNGVYQQPSMICVEPRPYATPAGHADALHARSLEMFKMLGFYEDLMKVSTEIAERARWAEPTPTPGSAPEITPASASNASGMERVMREKIALAPNARMKQLIGTAQGQIERILEADLTANAPNALLRDFQITDVQMDETYASHPILVTIRGTTCDGSDNPARLIRCKYLVGADGAHSTVRKKLGITMEGDSTDHVWGVTDFVTDTDFPDIRRLTTVQNRFGMAMCIPREKNAQGEWLTRFYVDMNDLETKRRQSANHIHDTDETNVETVFIKNQARKSAITIDDIHQRLTEIFAPFRMAIKTGTEVDWSTAYAIGQRVASEFIKMDSNGVPRVFLVGDACHTHSPKNGQGMNVSMADSFNLAWKLSHAVHGTAADPKALLTSYATERRLIAQQLIAIDRKWYEIQWADSERQKQPGFQEECNKLFQDLSGFFSGCGIQYDRSLVVAGVDDGSTNVIHSTPENEEGLTPNSGMVRPGRRLLNTCMMRVADGAEWDIHDDLIPDGALFKLLVFCDRDVFNANGQSAKALQIVFDQVLRRYSNNLVNASVVAPEMVRSPNTPSTDVSAFAEHEVWSLLPGCVKRAAEMKTYVLSKVGYDTYGIDVDTGAMLIIRPDGIVGAVFALDPKTVGFQVEEYLGGILSADEVKESTQA